MRRLLLATGLVLVAFQGCDDSGPSPISPLSSSAAPHQGTVFVLGDKKANVEILSVKPKGGGRQQASTIVAYFYSYDMVPLAADPTDVSFKLGSPGAVKEIALKPQPGKDKSEVGRFASEPTNLDRGLEGEIVATIDGQSLSAKVLAR